MAGIADGGSHRATTRSSCGFPKAITNKMVYWHYCMCLSRLLYSNDHFLSIYLWSVSNQWLIHARRTQHWHNPLQAIVTVFTTKTGIVPVLSARLLLPPSNLESIVFHQHRNRRTHTEGRYSMKSAVPDKQIRWISNPMGLEVEGLSKDFRLMKRLNWCMVYWYRYGVWSKDCLDGA